MTALPTGPMHLRTLWRYTNNVTSFISTDVRSGIINLL